MSPRDWLQFRQKKHASKYKYTSSWYVLRLGGLSAKLLAANYCQGQFVRDVGAARWKANASAMSLKRGDSLQGRAGQGRAGQGSEARADAQSSAGLDHPCRSEQNGMDEHVIHTLKAPCLADTAIGASHQGLKMKTPAGAHALAA